MEASEDGGGGEGIFRDVLKEEWEGGGGRLRRRRL